MQQGEAALIKEFRRRVIEIFNRDDFFSCPRQVFQAWKQIVHLVSTDSGRELLAEYMDKLSLTSSIFSRENRDYKAKVKGFKRICFVIFSGWQNQYVKSVEGLLGKISEVIGNPEDLNQNLLILILFCVRILLLRLTQENVCNLFKNVWPMLLTVLI